MIKKKKEGFLRRRLINNTKYSFQGLNSTFKEEEAFKIEVILTLFLIPLGFYLGQNEIEKILLIATVIIVLIVEMLNSAIESVVDRIGFEKHDLSKRAKDQGSAAVFMSLVLFLFVWILILF